MLSIADNNGCPWMTELKVFPPIYFERAAANGETPAWSSTTPIQKDIPAAYVVPWPKGQIQNRLPTQCKTECSLHTA